jgi:hypothetical protein
VGDNYAKLVKNNLEILFKNLPDDLDIRLGARKKADEFTLPAFGKSCRITSDGIFLNNKPENGVLGILISLYALNACPEPAITAPFIAFREIPNSTPYVGAFVTHTATILVPHVTAIHRYKSELTEALYGMPTPDETPGDFAMLLFPLPKIGLYYIFNEADDEFPASVNCLFSNNSYRFLPVDGLADVGEYTSKAILTYIEPATG